MFHAKKKKCILRYSPSLWNCIWWFPPETCWLLQLFFFNLVRDINSLFKKASTLSIVAETWGPPMISSSHRRFLHELPMRCVSMPCFWLASCSICAPPVGLLTSLSATIYPVACRLPMAVNNLHESHLWLTLQDHIWRLSILGKAGICLGPDLWNQTGSSWCCYWVV